MKEYKLKYRFYCPDATVVPKGTIFVYFKTIGGINLFKSKDGSSQILMNEELLKKATDMFEAGTPTIEISNLNRRILKLISKGESTTFYMKADQDISIKKGEDLNIVLKMQKHEK